MDDFAIKIENVSKVYKLYKIPTDRLKESLHPFKKKYHKDFYALKNISLNVKKGEVVGIVGKNGCGKSTLLKLISGVLTPNEGAIEVNGKISALLELGSGFNPEFTGLQNIYFYGTILGVSRSDMTDKLQEILDFAELGEFIDQPLKTYSSGMKSRLGFSVAVHIEPEILILDEVLSVGDEQFKRKCYAKMEEFFHNGKTILYVSHDVNSIKHLCSRAIFIDKGSLLLDGDSNYVTNNYHKYYLLDLKQQQKLRSDFLNGVTTKGIGSKFADNISSDSAKNSVDSKSEVSSNIINDHYVEFSEFYISDESGNKVNHLSLNKKYKLVFTTYFKSDLNNISIGVQVRTIKGVIVSGANMKSYDNQIIDSVSKNDKFINSMSFTCYLLPGSYVITVFMDDGHGKSSVYYDALLFKVIDNVNVQGGLVTLNQSFRINKL